VDDRSSSPSDSERGRLSFRIVAGAGIVVLLLSVFLVAARWATGGGEDRTPTRTSRAASREQSPTEGLAPALLCGTTLPRPLVIPPSYTGPQRRAVDDASTPPSATQLVLSWKSATGDLEVRWPADAQLASVFVPNDPPDASPVAGVGVVIPFQPQPTTTGRLFNYVAFQLADQAPECQTVQLTAFDTDAGRVNETINQLEQRPFASTPRLVNGSRTADAAPDVVACPTPPGVSSPNRGGRVSGLGVYPTPEGALDGFVKADQTLIQFGYQELRLPDGSITYAVQGPMGGWVTVIHVAPTEGGWAVKSWIGSGC
jgi:hypothetical protein